MTSITTLTDLERWLANRGNGVGISRWNDCFDVTCMTGDLKGGARTILGSGLTINEAVQRAEARIAELAAMNLTPQQHVRNLARPIPSS